jgi:hypothetical protein
MGHGTAPNLTQLRDRTWLATTPTVDRRRIGVVGATPVEAEMRLREALARWEEIAQLPEPEVRLPAACRDEAKTEGPADRLRRASRAFE